MSKEHNNGEQHSSDSESNCLSRLKTISTELEALDANDGLNKLEKMSIFSLISYVSYISGAHEDIIRSMVETHFSVDDFTKINPKNFEDAIRFLINLNPKEAVN